MSCNKYCNFTNYGSALQTFALQQTIDKIDPENIKSVVIDYCPDTLKGVDILNPFANMWDQDDESQTNCRLSLEAIKTNKEKFDRFYENRLNMSLGQYSRDNLKWSLEKENLSGYVIGSDTVFCLEEFKLDDGFFANHDVMRGRSVSYGASFGDSKFDSGSYSKLNQLLNNFNALGIRENKMIPYVISHVECPVSRTIDPTLLLSCSDYDCITSDKQYDDPYLLLYTRRYNKNMDEYARRIASKNGWKLVEISLRATNSKKGSIMRYDAGIEEFLSLVKHSQMVVTNSFHGMIFSVQYSRPFIAFSRNECDTKIIELLELFGISDRLFINGNEPNPEDINYKDVHRRIETEKLKSIDFLKRELLSYIHRDYSLNNPTI